MTDHLLEKARKTGKFTRLEPGKYCVYAEEKLYYVRKREFVNHRGQFKHEWYWTDGEKPYDEWYETLAECKKALYDFFNQQGITHSLTQSQYIMLSVAKTAKGKVVYFYDEPYKTPGAKKIARSLKEKELLNCQIYCSTTEVPVWVE
jgi:hypothetical protein